MALNLSERFSRGRDIIVSAGPSKVVVGGIILAAATAVLLFILFYNSSPSYGVLYAQLSPEDASAITNELKTQKIPYKLAADGSAIEVNANEVPAIRINLAGKGLPAKSSVGFEILDNQKLGVTDLVQKTNLMRAVTGELERTIKSMPEIENVRVHISVPKETLFIEDQEKPKASVLVALRPGASLSKAQIMGMVHLVTASVDGLKADGVSIVDSEGGLIWNNDMNSPGLFNDDQAKQKQAFEEGLKRRIQNMMERVVGSNKVTTTVLADLDFREVTTTEDIWDPERTAIRSEQKIVEKETGPGRAMAGVPNATYELGTANRQNSGSGANQTQYSRSEETNNYEVTNIKRQTISKAGDLKKLSVSVILDGLYSKNAQGETVFTPLPQETLTKLEESIKGIMGFDAARGDTVSVTSMQFANSDELPVWLPFLMDLLREFSRPVVNMILILLFFFFVVRPIINWLKKEVEPVGSGAEPAVLPEYPSQGPNFGDGLPLPAAPKAEPMAQVPHMDDTMSLAGAHFDDMPATLDSGPNYDNEEEEVGGKEPVQLTYGSLSRENILPLAKNNLERTVGLVRSWIEQKPQSAADEAKM